MKKITSHPQNDNFLFLIALFYCTVRYIQLFYAYHVQYLCFWVLHSAENVRQKTSMVFGSYSSKSLTEIIFF